MKKILFAVMVMGMCLASCGGQKATVAEPECGTPDSVEVVADTVVEVVDSVAVEVAE